MVPLLRVATWPNEPPCILKTMTDGGSERGSGSGSEASRFEESAQRARQHLARLCAETNRDEVEAAEGLRLFEERAAAMDSELQSIARRLWQLPLPRVAEVGWKQYWRPAGEKGSGLGTHWACYSSRFRDPRPGRRGLITSGNPLLRLSYPLPDTGNALGSGVLTADLMADAPAPPDRKLRRKTGDIGTFTTKGTVSRWFVRRALSGAGWPDEHFFVTADGQCRADRSKTLGAKIASGDGSPAQIEWVQRSYLDALAGLVVVGQDTIDQWWST